MSSVALSSTVSSLRTSKTGSSEHVHAAFNVERRAHAAELEAELHARDGDRGPHPPRDGCRSEDARRGRQVVQHSADERIDELEGRDVDEHTLGPRLDDLLREVLLELHRHAVVQVDLDRDEQEPAHAQDRDFLHGQRPGDGPTARPRRSSAWRNPSASDAFVTTSPRSTPRCTIVCAICGRMPLMMHSAPMSFAAATVFNRCCATSVSTVGTPVMSMTAIDAPEVTISSSNDSMTTWVRALSSVPTNGTARTPSHRRVTGVDSSSSSCCWREMSSSRLFWKTSIV